MNYAIRSSFVYSVVLLLAFLQFGTPAARACMVCDLTTGVTWNFTAVQNGTWANAATWQQGVVPTAGSHVRIPAGVTVTVNAQHNDDYKKVFVEGTLRFAVAATSRLKFDTLIVAASGTLRAGTVANPLTGYAELIVVPTVGLDAAEKGRGIVSEGTVGMVGVYKTPFTAVSGNALAGATGVTLLNTPVNWQAGDDILVASTHFDRTAPLQNEFRTISSTSGSTVTLNSALAYTHRRPRAGKEFHVANLTRNIEIKSQNPGTLKQRGHVMFMGADVYLQSVLFRDLGRTDKTKIFSTTNPEGRYSCHFHQARYSQQAQVLNCVVRGSPGWGFVNHSSWVKFSECVAVDFTGAGFNSEAGDEIGSFLGNFAAHGHGNGQFFETGELNKPANAARLSVGDLGWTGIGFWLVSPRLTVEGNVAAGLKGPGIQFMTTGKKEMSQNGKYIGMPMDRVPAGVTPRTWKHTNPWTGATMALTSDLPLISFQDNKVYGSFQGTRMRWISHNGNHVYENTGDFTEQMIRSAAGYTGIREAGRVRSDVHRLHVWNVEVGHHHRYNEKMVRGDCTAEIDINVMPKQVYGFDISQGTPNNIIQNCTIIRFGVGMLVDPQVDRRNLTFTQCNTNIVFF